MIDGRNGEAGDTIDLEDTIVIETTDGKRHEYEIVSVVSDPETNATYGVAYSEATEDFVVTDERGNLIEDQELAREIIADFETFAEESAAEED